MNDTSYLARLALSRLPRPYTDEVVLHVFCEIERTPHLRKRYEALIAATNKGQVNREISRVVTGVLGAVTSESMDVSDICEIVSSVSRLAVGIDSDWSW